MTSPAPTDVTADYPTSTPRRRPSRTAEYMALFRAIESGKPASDRLFDDHFASRFLNRGLGLAASLAGVPFLGRIVPWIIEQRWLGPLASAIVRTRDIDDVLASELISDRARQLLILGSGFDSRAHRTLTPAESSKSTNPPPSPASAWSFSAGIRQIQPTSPCRHEVNCVAHQREANHDAFRPVERAPRSETPEWAPTSPRREGWAPGPACPRGARSWPPRRHACALEQELHREERAIQCAVIKVGARSGTAPFSDPRERQTRCRARSVPVSPASSRLACAALCGAPRLGRDPGITSHRPQGPSTSSSGRAWTASTSPIVRPRRKTPAARRL